MLYVNRCTIEELQPRDYPNLYKLLYERRGNKQKRLCFLLETCENMPNKEHEKHGDWCILPYTRLVTLGAEYAASTQTWKHTITLFIAIGLLERKIPTAETAKTPYERAAVQYAAEKGNGNRHAAEFLRFPAYSPRQLNYCERKAKLWYEKKGNFQDWSKASVIDIFGTETANRVYNDGRIKPRYKHEAEAALMGAIVSLLETSPFTTKAQVQAAAAETLKETGATDEGKAVNLARRTWDRAHNDILEQCGALHKRPTNEEKEQFGLIGNGWIITYMQEV